MFLVFVSNCRTHHYDDSFILLRYSAKRQLFPQEVAPTSQGGPPAAKGFSFDTFFAVAANEAEDKKPAAKGFGFGSNLTSPAPAYSASAGFTFVGPPVPAGGFTFAPSTPARPPAAAVPPQGFAALSNDDDDVSL